MRPTPAGQRRVGGGADGAGEDTFAGESGDEMSGGVVPGGPGGRGVYKFYFNIVSACCDLKRAACTSLCLHAHSPTVLSCGNKGREEGGFLMGIVGGTIRALGNTD